MNHQARAPAPVVVAGPLPPPLGGATVCMDLFRAWLAREAPRVSVVDCRFGSSAWPWRAPFAIARLLRRTVGASRVALFASQRSATWAGGLLAALGSLRGTLVSLRIFGGAWDAYLAGLPAPARALALRLLSRCTAVAVETDLVGRATAGLLPGLVTVVPNYRPRAASEPPVRSGGPLRLMFAGRVCRSKGVPELLEAFARLGGTERATLDLYGPVAASGPEAVALPQVPGLRCHGEVPQADVLAAYAAHDVLVHPSHWEREGHPGTILEALAAGRPVVAARWRSVPEVVEDGVSGLLAEPRDARSLEACLRRLAAEPGLVERLARGAAGAAARFDAAVVCPRLAEVLGVTA